MGDEPWDAGGAADWLTRLFAKTRLAARVVKGLDADLEDDPEIIRAAAHLVVLLGHTSVWPEARLDEDIAYALARLEALANEGIVSRAALKADIDALRARSAPARIARMPLLWTVDLGGGPVSRLGAVGPNRWVAGTDRALALLDDRGKVVRELPPAKALLLQAEVFATTRDVFVCTDAGQTIVCATKTGALLHRWDWKRAGLAASAAVAADGRAAVVLTRDGTLNVLDLVKGRVRHRLDHPLRAGDGACAIGPDIAASSWGEAVRLWDLLTGKPTGTLEHPHRGLEMTADGARVLTYTSKGFAVWNVATRKRVVQRSPVENTPDAALVLDLQTRLLRKRGPGDIPHFRPRHSVWLDARRRVTTRETVEDGEPELLLHRVDEREKEHVIARAAIAHGRVSRVATTHDRRILIVGDRTARVCAFGVPA